jgi:hypothetical protein
VAKAFIYQSLLSAANVRKDDFRIRADSSTSNNYFACSRPKAAMDVLKLQLKRGSTVQILPIAIWWLHVAVLKQLVLKIG